MLSFYSLIAYYETEKLSYSSSFKSIHNISVSSYDYNNIIPEVNYKKVKGLIYESEDKKTKEKVWIYYEKRKKSLIVITQGKNDPKPTTTKYENFVLPENFDFFDYVDGEVVYYTKE